MKKEETLQTLKEWFSNSGLPEGFEFVGVLVFERIHKVKTNNRIALAVDEVSRRLWETRTLPFSSQPNSQWEGAKCVGFASTFEEAVDLMQLEITNEVE